MKFTIRELNISGRDYTAVAKKCTAKCMLRTQATNQWHCLVYWLSGFTVITAVNKRMFRVNLQYGVLCTQAPTDCPNKLTEPSTAELSSQQVGLCAEIWRNLARLTHLMLSQRWLWSAACDAVQSVRNLMPAHSGSQSTPSKRESWSS
jgi:hypothetical protein